MASAITQQVLHGIGNDVVNEIVKTLGTHFNTGDLANSIHYEIKDDGTINIIMLDYWKYLEYGTPGTKQGQSSTVGAKTVSFGPKPDRKMPLAKNGDSFVNLITGGLDDFALAKHIQLYGTKPYPFVRPVIYHKLPDIVKRNLERGSV